MSTPFTGMLDEAHQAIVDSDICLFELQKAKINHAGDFDPGFFDVVARERPDTRGNITRSIDWRMGNSSGIRYEPDNKTGICYAFCPDDPWYHNRIMLAATIKSGAYLINRYITPDGIIPGSRITDEVNYLEELTHEWKINVDKRTVFRSKDVAAIKRKVADITAKGQNPHVVYGKVERIERIMREHGHKWLMMPDFQQGVVPDLREAIEAKFAAEDNNAASRPVDIRKEVVGILKSLTPQERLSLLSEAGSEAPEKRRGIEGKNIKDLSDDELRGLAERSYGVKDAAEMTRDQLFGAIQEKSGLKFSFADDEGGNKADEGQPFPKGQVVNFT
jgi:hypothetical protein